MKRTTRKKRPARTVHFAIVLALEILVYALLVTAYLLLALRSLRPLLLDAFEHHRAIYAILAVLLMLGQGLLLELLTTALVGFVVRARQREGLSTAGFED